MYKADCLYVNMFVIGKLGSIAVYPTYNTYSLNQHDARSAQYLIRSH